MFNLWPNQRGDTWRNRTKRELWETFGNDNTVSATKSGRLRCRGIVAMIKDDRAAKNVLQKKVDGTRARAKRRKK